MTFSFVVFLSVKPRINHSGLTAHNSCPHNADQDKCEHLLFCIVWHCSYFYMNQKGVCFILLFYTFVQHCKDKLSLTVPDYMWQTGDAKMYEKMWTTASVQSASSYITDLTGGWGYTAGFDFSQLDITEHRKVPQLHRQGFG